MDISTMAYFLKILAIIDLQIMANKTKGEGGDPIIISRRQNMNDFNFASIPNTGGCGGY